MKPEEEKSSIFHTCFLTVYLPFCKQDKTRLSIFSVIHPALHAAFAAERASDRPAPPLEPLTKVEYHSSPLRGTEARDRAAIGLLPSAQQERQARNNDHQALETTPTTPTQRDVSTLKAPSSYEYAGMPPPLRQPGDIQQKNLPKPANSSVQDHEGYSSTANFPTTLLSYPQDAVPHGRDMPEVPAVPIPAALVSQDGYVLPGSTATTAQTIPLVPTIAPETPRIQQAALDSLESVWNRLVSTAKRTLETIMTSQESAASSSDIAANPAMHQNLPRGAAPTPSADYSKKDVTEIVNDIMHQIQSHQEDMQAHQEMLKNTGRWDPDHLTKRERQHGVKAPMLVMRKSMPLSPEVLADAVTKSATKLIRAKPSPMPWAVASRLLTDVHSQLADILQQASAISEKGTPSQNNARGLPRVERLAGTQTDVTQTGRAVTKSLQRGNGVQQMGKNSAPRAEPRMATEWQQRQAQSQQIAWQGSPSMGRSL